MSLRFTISAGLFLLCSSPVVSFAGETQDVSGYPVPLREQEARSEGYESIRASAAFAAKTKGYTNEHAEVGFLCRALTQPIGPNLYMLAVYQSPRGTCEAMYKKAIP